MSIKVKVDGLVYTHNTISQKQLDCIITNDAHGKTLSINDGNTQFTIAFEQIEKYLK